LHVAFGHEAIAVAVNAMMHAGDALVLSHRNIAYNLARAGALQPILDEYRLAPTGVAGGKLGSMNLANPGRGVVYTSSILGNNMPVATGLALGLQLRQRSNIVTVLTGDGAMEEGTLYETLTITRYQNLPCMILIENNKYAMSSTIAERRCHIDVAHLCAAVGTSFFQLQGNDVSAYRTQLTEIRATMLRESMPTCVEVDLANLNRHAGPTPGWPTDPMNIDLQRGLIIQESAYDPLYVLKQRLPAALYAELENEALAQPPSV
jgi:TPP-dependent pyruvate/acetoin dehydrogenase alpha subunit